MKLLLTSGGVTNDSIRRSLVTLLGKPIDEATALCIPTAAYAGGNFLSAANLIRGTALSPLAELGWKSIGLLELTALPSLDREVWVKAVSSADALLVGGGDPIYLANWMQESGLRELFDSLPAMVYVGVSAGSMVMGPRIGEDFVGHQPRPHGDVTLGVTDFAIFPHLDHPRFPDNNLATARAWWRGLDCSAYVLDDQSAVQVLDEEVSVVSEGAWHVLDVHTR